jgi:NAD(P)H dehydrogenase (quinone)
VPTESLLIASGHRVVRRDLCQAGFDPASTPQEREHSFKGTCDRAGVEKEVMRLTAAEAVVLVFPTWWFSFPAAPRGWFDRPLP